MTKKPAIDTDEQAIDALGGTTNVAAVFGVTPGAVSQWRDEGIPLSRRFRFKRELETRGFSVPPDFIERAVA